MARHSFSPIHTAGPRPRPKPRIYNRPWHLDADDRRHQGNRKWDPAAIEAVIDLAGQIERLYPPDFAARDAVRFRASGNPKPVAELRTSQAACLRLILHPHKRVSITNLSKRLGLAVAKARAGIEVQFHWPSQVAQPEFAQFLRECL